MRFFRRRLRRQIATDTQVYRFNRLADYNSEVARGILHTKEYDELMRRTQEEFDAYTVQGGEPE